MAFKLLFVRKSTSSFKVYIIQKHKLCVPVLSGQLTKLKFGQPGSSDVFVQNLITKKVIAKKYFRDIRFFNNCIIEFFKFVTDARNKKVLCIFGSKEIVFESFF